MAVDGGEWLNQASVALPVGKKQISTEQGAGWAPELVWMFWRTEKISYLCRYLNPEPSSA